jgi:hypothetical protein
MVPTNLLIALVAAALVASVFIVVGPLKDPSKLYAIAAQIMPAFLIAVAVEHSLLDSLGTKADFARVRRDETADSYSEPGLSGGVRNTIEFALLDRQGEALPDGDRELLSVPVGKLEIAQAHVIGNWDDDPMSWHIFRGLINDECGLPADDPDFFEDPKEWVDPSPAFGALRESVLSREPGRAIRWLAARAALREDRDFSGGTVGTQLVAAELNRLFAAQDKAAREDVLKRVTYRANRAYNTQREQRTLSLLSSIVLLTTTEFLALIGVMSPGRPYSGLFLITAALVAASIMNVAGGAFADLADRRAR